ncbi:bifunctional heptose 7-phosphate kinase/heptose 1-phosphate adenyltransferase [Saccharopolyspora aridisoli]|uniref:Bifunctional heptose 7-phosphate kinase/heptose 1-phosphate adenyltransferase n=1 Tax=Saccharopolyspora aridisoli TaxID=2530385 RepID=A0A4R4UNT5_9PSEU|nr:PfkB family carbohydrate kinase [Saccharopolyspora aridisoli]TDC93410.1 bifunctional heptose 7-phosphate kinase/heptose 1-phosphate adenyltransferase [Saccharopolyspora aridisoli]
MKLVIVGDALLDLDLTGSASRLCPDAPVPVVDVESRRGRPGGAALAAALAVDQGTEVTLISGRGADPAGYEIDRLLPTGVRLVDLPFTGGTPSKTRVRAGGQSVVRLDSGAGAVPDVVPGPAVVRELRSADAVLVADYGRGAANNSRLRHELSRLPPGTPLVWDPHPRGAAPVARSDLVVPNEAEAMRFSGMTAQPAGAMALWREWECGAVAVTMGERGAALAPSCELIAAPELDTAIDTCGAGDAFAVAAALALARAESTSDAVADAVLAASRFVASGGAGAWTAGDRPVSENGLDVVERVRERGGRLVAAGGCFDLLHPGHVDLLSQARRLGDALVVCLNSDASVRRLKGAPRPLVGVEDRKCLLEALESVDAVAVFEETTPCELLAAIRPDVWVKGGDYEPSQLPEARVVEQYGGEIVRVPLVGGYSTTRMLRNLLELDVNREELHERAG